MCIIHLAVLLSLLFGSRGYHCPVNCKCEEYWASCNLLTGDDKIVTDVPLLSIHGRLCPNHYTILSHAGGGLYIQLHGSYCYDLQRCE